MCEVDVYIYRDGQDELFMAGVDRLIPGEDCSILMENLLGERRIIKARIKGIELVHHRIILEEIPEATAKRPLESWLEPDTDHGHFHEGEVRTSHP